MGFNPKHPKVPWPVLVCVILGKPEHPQSCQCEHHTNWAEQVLSRKEDVQYMHLFTKSAFGMVLLIVTKCAKSGANIPVKVGEMDGRSYEGEQELLFWNYFMCKI